MYIYIINKRPIMSVNLESKSQTGYTESQNKLSKLRELLALNQHAQMSLQKIKQDIQFRKKELEEIGMLSMHSREKVNQIFDSGSALNEVKKVPTFLYQQLLIKKNSAHQYGFVKNIMIEQKQQKNKKTKCSKPLQISTTNLGADPRLICFASEAERFGKSGIQLYRDWRSLHKKRQVDDKKLMLIDENKLLEKRKIYGDNWEKIGYFFNGFTFQDLYYYFQKNLNKVQTGKWSLRQNLTLIALVQYYGSGKWALISKKLKVKSQFQIRQRFCNVLDPKIKENKWTQQEQKLLLDIAYTKKYKWSKIAKQIPQFANKTDNALRRKFRNLMIKKDKEQIAKLIKNKKLKQSILNFKKDYYNRKKKISSIEVNQNIIEKQ